MGPGLADGRPDNLATRQRVANRAALGHRAQSTVSGHTRFLHDGRARDLEEAILWHGGEGKAAQQRFAKSSRDERAALLAYLASL